MLKYNIMILKVKQNPDENGGEKRFLFLPDAVSPFSRLKKKVAVLL